MAWQTIIIDTVEDYLIIGASLNFLLFLLAKIKGMDFKHSGWDTILNSVSGFLYFILLGSVVWLPVILSFLSTRQKRKQEGSWWQRIKKPYRTIRELIKFH